MNGCVGVVRPCLWSHRYNEDPDDWSRVTFDESFTKLDKVDFSMLHDKVKVQMYKQWKEDPATWTVPKLATTYKVSQPRVQAILLLKEWEEEERALGLVTAHRDGLEDAMYNKHMAAVAQLEDEYKMPLRKDRYVSVDEAESRGGPLGKYQVLKDDEDVPEKPDPEGPAKKDDKVYLARKQREREQEAAHLRVKNKRWTFVVKDT